MSAADRNLVDHEVMRIRLQSWLADRLPNAREPRLSALRLPSGTGNSAETTFADLTYTDGDGKRDILSLVIRRQLSSADLFLDADIRLPYRMMEALGRHPAIPSARALGVESDPAILGSPFLVMEAVDGRIVNQVPNYNVEGWVADLPVEQRGQLWHSAIEVLAQLHEVDWRDGFGFLDDRARGEPGLDQFLKWTADWYEWAKAGRELTVADAALEYLITNRPDNTETCVLWGDPTPANTLFKPAERLFEGDSPVAAILDFEMAILGPGEADLAWWLESEENFSTYSGLPKLRGLPSRDEIVAIYEQVRGRPVQHLDYFVLLAWLRQTIVIIRFADRLVQEGRMPAGTDVLTNNPSTNLMAQRLGLPECPPGDGFVLMLGGMAGAK